jgi:hypothetical protein
MDAAERVHEMRNQKKLILVILFAQLVGCESSLVGWPEIDGTAPTVSSVTPVDGAVDVATNASITAIFSEEMAPETISTATFSLFEGELSVAGAVTCSGVTAIFAPMDNLKTDTLYTATITSQAADLAGNTLVEDYVWTFITADTVPPTILSTVPADGALGVALDANVFATFSENMDALTLTELSFTLMKESVAVPGVGTIIDNVVMFDPVDDLEPNTEYTAPGHGGSDGPVRQRARSWSRAQSMDVHDQSRPRALCFD